MHVLVTGGTGSVGPAVVQRLLEGGHRVRVLGRRAEAGPSGCDYRVCDVNDVDGLVACAQGCEAIVHLAAVPRPAVAPAPEVFRTNVSGTFNVFHAAECTGIRTVVQASSINALGALFGRVDLPLRYLPLDEDHPTLATDAYSFSKDAAESVGDYFWRRCGIRSVALRLPGVWRAPGTVPVRRTPAQYRAVHETLDRLARGPQSGRDAALAWVLEQTARFRAERIAENGPAWGPFLDGLYARNPELAGFVLSRLDFWVALDDRDAALAVERALLAKYEGSHVLFVNDTRNWLGYDAATLASLFFPGVPQRPTLAGDAAFVSAERARKLIGFEPVHHVADRYR